MEKCCIPVHVYKYGGDVLSTCPHVLTGVVLCSCPHVCHDPFLDIDRKQCANELNYMKMVIKELKDSHMGKHKIKCCRCALIHNLCELSWSENEKTLKYISI